MDELSLRGWSVVREMDLDDGSPGCYEKKYGSYQWWITKYPSAWAAEVKVKVLSDEREIIRVRDFKSPLAAARWINKHHGDWTDEAW